MVTGFSAATSVDGRNLCSKPICQAFVVLILPMIAGDNGKRSSVTIIPTVCNLTYKQINFTIACPALPALYETNRNALQPFLDRIL